MVFFGADAICPRGKRTLNIFYRQRYPIISQGFSSVIVVVRNFCDDTISNAQCDERKLKYENRSFMCNIKPWVADHIFETSVGAFRTHPREGRGARTERVRFTCVPTNIPLSRLTNSHYRG